VVPRYFVRGLGLRLRWAHAQLLGEGCSAEIGRHYVACLTTSSGMVCLQWIETGIPSEII